MVSIAIHTIVGGSRTMINYSSLQVEGNGTGIWRGMVQGKHLK